MSFLHSSLKWALAIFFVLLPIALSAHPVKIKVTDKDLASPLQGVSIKLSGGNTVTTDATGTAILDLDNDSSSIWVTLALIGYETKKLKIEMHISEAETTLGIATITSDKELVVEAPKYSPTSESGTSLSLQKQEIQNSAAIGLVEDAMNAVKTLPGVSYVGNFNAVPSIRGGRPTETVATLDGVTVLAPYQWYGGFTIFDPGFVNSLTLSSGTISAEYGQLISGLIEARSPETQDDQAHLSIGVSTDELSASSQIPIGKDAGILLSAKAVSLGIVLPVVDSQERYDPYPYIYNGYARLFWNPSPSAKFSLSSFVGSDGIGNPPRIFEAQNVSEQYRYNAVSGFVAGSGKVLISDSTQLAFSVAWNRYFIDTSSSTFYITNPSVENTYHLDDTTNSFESKLDVTTEIGSGQLLSVGIAADLLQFSATNDNQNSVYNTQPYLPPHPVAVNGQFIVPFSVADDEAGHVAAYASYQFSFLDALFTGECGVRADYTVFFNATSTLPTAPALGPRVHLVFTPVKDSGIIENLNFSLGTGLYSQFSDSLRLFNSKYSLSNFSLRPDTSWNSIAGGEIKLVNDVSLSIEGYFKTYLDRTYIYDYADTTSAIIKTDGTGQSFGFDILLKKGISRYVDGYISYSYNNTRMKNPTLYNNTPLKSPASSNNRLVKNPTSEVSTGQNTFDGDPLGQEYYPYNQRFHTVNLILDIKPSQFFAISIKASYASGRPDENVGPNGLPQYSDTLRTGPSFPIDIKLTWSNYFDQSKVRWQLYVGVQDIFASIYNPQSQELNTLYGSHNADFNFGIPLPSIGFKVDM